jgi:hypothetical protein
MTSYVRHERYQKKPITNGNKSHAYVIVEEDHHEAKADEGHEGDEKEACLCRKVDFGLARKDGDGEHHDRRDPKCNQNLGIWDKVRDVCATAVKQFKQNM